MTNQGDSQRSKVKRRKYVIDWRLQMAITAQLLGVLFGVGCLYTVGVFVLPKGDALTELSASDVSEVIMRANAIYFALGAAILGTIAILLTHRVAGPAFVVERAVDGMRKGLFEHRLKLRRRDYLKPLAAAVDGLREDLLKHRSERAKIVTDLDRCLQEGDVAAARELIVALRSEEFGAKAAGEDAKVVVEAPAAEAEPAATEEKAEV